MINRLSDYFKNRFNNFFCFLDLRSFTGLRMPVDKRTGRTKGFAYVQFPDESSAETAVNSLENFELEGRIVKVNIALPRTDKPDRSTERPARNQDTSIYIGNLDFETSIDDIVGLCSEVLGVDGVKVRISSDRETGKQYQLITMLLD